MENEQLGGLKFRNRIAGMSRTIPIYLQSEGEEYGMNQDIYVALMGYKKSKPSLFQSMMTTGNFTLEGSSSYSSRKVVICVPSLESTLNSFIPLSFMEVKKSEEPESILGIKRKPGERGPGRKDFTFDRTPSAVSRALTAKLIAVIEESLELYNNQNNKRKIIEASLKTIAKEYHSVEEKDSDNAIINSAKKYLQGLAIFGGKFTTTQATIDTILTSLVASGIPNNAIASSLGVSRKRVAKAKYRRVGQHKGG